MVLHMIGNAHLDPAWFWQWTEGYHEAKATFRSALDRMNEYPDFVFTCSAAAYYEWIEQDEPEMFAEIRRRVQEGRWAIVGGWWIQPDCNAPCGGILCPARAHCAALFPEPVWHARAHRLQCG